MQISKINKKISLVLFALLLVFSFFGTSFAAPQPTLTLTANPTTVTPTNSSSTVTWSSTNTTTCTSNAGNHPVGPSGSFNTGPLADTTTYTMVCTGPGGSVTKSVTIVMDLGLGGSSGSGTPPIDTSNPTPIIPPSNNQIDSFLDSQNSQTTTDGTYKWLEKLPGFDDSFDPTKKCSFVDYLNIMIKLLIGIGAVLAMVMIVMGGMEYMTNELISSKEEGISRIKNAMLGLVIALSSYLILNTLNPDLLNLCLDNLPTAKITITDEPEDGIGQGLVGEEITLTKKTGGTVKLKACDQSQMQTVTVFGKSVTVYKGLVPSLQRANTQWLAKPPSERYPVKSIGGYNCRKVKGKSSWSAHAYGTAIDINPEENPFGPNKVTDMPAWFIQILKSEGWGWGGDWNSVKDAMHYSKYPTSENGNGIVEI